MAEQAGVVLGEDVRQPGGPCEPGQQLLGAWQMAVEEVEPAALGRLVAQHAPDAARGDPPCHGAAVGDGDLVVVRPLGIAAGVGEPPDGGQGQRVDGHHVDDVGDGRRGLVPFVRPCRPVLPEEHGDAHGSLWHIRGLPGRSSPESRKRRVPPSCG